MLSMSVLSGLFVADGSDKTSIYRRNVLIALKQCWTI